MTQEDKELLLKDLSARWTTALKCAPSTKNSIVAYCTVDGIKKDIKGGSFIELIDRDSDGNALASTSTNEFDMVKPYLCSMSSMTDKEKLHIELTYGFFYHDGILDNVDIFEAGGIYDRDGNYDPPCIYGEKRYVTIEQVLDFIHWLNSHHFDYRGLIEKGLALEAPEGMYK